MAQGSRIRGGGSLQQRLKNLPEGVLTDLVSELGAIGGRLLARAKSETPRRTGALQSELEVKVLPGSLRLKLGLLTKGQQREFFYGFILDGGRKTLIRRGPRKGRRFGGNYAISPARYNFIFGRRADFRKNELPGLRSAYVKAVKRALKANGNG